MATVIGISTDEFEENVAYASKEIMNVGELDNPTAVSKGNTEKFKAEFAYEMAQITANIISAPTTSVENFKVEFAYATAKVTAKVMPIISSDQRNEFAYEMAQITTEIISDQNLDIEKAKVKFTYEIAQLTTKIITNAAKIATGEKTMLKVHNDYPAPESAGKVNNIGTGQSTTLLRNNADIERKATRKASNTGSTEQKANVTPVNISPDIYNGLIDELMHVGDRSNHLDNKVNIDGEIRYHYAFNRGFQKWDKDSSGIRAYFGFGTNINKDWRVNGLLDLEKSLVNYNDKIDFSRINVTGKIGSTMVTAGSFSYPMAEKNIFDSGFKGARVSFGEPVKYTLNYGRTDYTKKTAIATARYTDFDYNLEAGVYHYQRDDGIYNQNTIRTFAGNYNFSNFSVGAMYLGSNLKDSKGDSNGYVFTINYGDLKTYVPGTYDIFAKYYNQPQGTYIVHGMNGVGSLMQGFKGYRLGTHYTFADNLVGGIEYYDLTDRVSGESGKTWWSELTHYF